MDRVIAAERAFGRALEPQGRDTLAALDRLAAELSSTVILHADRIPGAIERAVHAVVDVLDDARCSVVRYTEDDSIEVAGSYAGAGVRSEGPDDLLTHPWYGERLRRCESIVLNRLPDDLPPEARGERAFVANHERMRSRLVLPVEIEGRKVCALDVATLRECRWTPPLVQRLRLIVEILASALFRGLRERSPRAAGGRTGPLDAENKYLREEIDDLHGFHEIVGEGPSLRASLAQVVEVASTDATVLLLGETGTGKELFARALHQRSHRRDRAFVGVNCAALPPALIESELFGHERGAFTGAIAQRQGRFELANRGTLLLDEIGDLPLELQSKLLRVLQEGEFERLGSSQKRKADVRFIAATHRDIGAMVADGRFRADLFYRLNVFPIRLPPLRERPTDIPRLVWYVIHRRQKALRRTITHVPAAVMERLQALAWPGNVRELQNVVERAMIHSPGDTLVLDDDLRDHSRASLPADGSTLDLVQRRHIEGTLAKCNWRINGAGNAAEQLGLHPNTLRFRMKKLGITRPRAVRGTGAPAGQSPVFCG